MGLLGIIQDGGVEGRVFIFSRENSKTATHSEQSLTGECWIPPEKIPHVQGQRKNPNKAVGRQKSRLESYPTPARDAQRDQTNCAILEIRSSFHLFPVSFDKISLDLDFIAL